MIQHAAAFKVNNSARVSKQHCAVELNPLRRGIAKAEVQERKAMTRSSFGI